jgi:hypothetical protein
MFILKAVLVIKGNVMITKRIKTVEYIQKLLEHSGLSKIIEIYTHIPNADLINIKNPFDDMKMGVQNNYDT